jgi:hypothetical protein
MTDFAAQISGNSAYGYSLGDLTGYNLLPADVYSVPQNFLSVIDSAYYYPTEFESGLNVNITKTA